MSNRTKRRVSWAWIALVSAYFLWEAGTYRGFYAWAAEWQIRNYGGYIPVLTFSAFALLFSLPALILPSFSSP